MVDSHCHLQFSQYKEDQREVIQRALENDVAMICIGTDLETSAQAVRLAGAYDNIWATVGLHPNDKIYDPEISAKGATPAKSGGQGSASGGKIHEYEKLLESKKVVAVGEVGLDYCRIKNTAEKQKIVFKQFIELAIKSELPLVIHSRDAFDDLLSILKSYFVNHKSHANGVVHSFTGSWKTAKRFIDLGFYIGLNGIITFSDEYEELVRNLPLDKILIETDAPYLAPVPNRGKRNEPVYVKFVAEKIAEIKNIGVGEVIKKTTENTKNLFKI